MASTSTTNVPQVCRTCLKHIYDTQYIYINSTILNIEGTIRQRLEGCLPELDLNITPAAVICYECSATLDVIQTFKNTCLQVEQRIHSYLQENSSTFTYVDLLQVAQPKVKQQLNVNDVRTRKKLKHRTNLPCPVDQEHCYARKADIKLVTKYNRIDGQDFEISDGEITLFNIDVVNNITIGEEIEFEEIHHGERKNIESCTEIDLSLKYTSNSSPVIATNEEVSKDCTPLKKSTLKTKSNKCRFCTYSTADANKFVLHIQSKHSGKGLKQTEVKEKIKPFKCTLCNFACVRRTVLSDHLKMHTGEKQYKCSQCNYRCNFKNNLENHMRIHTGKPNRFKCSMCNFSTPSKANLIVHIRSHTGEKPYKCMECSFTCNSKNRLKLHMIVKHTEETPFKCHLCDYSAKLKSYIFIHMKSHTGEKPYKCSECDFACIAKNALVIHKRIHTGEKPYKCTKCEYKGISKSTLNSHLKTHLNDKLYKCKECEYTSRWNGALKIHMRVHKQDNSLNCLQCEYRCSNRTRLNSHMKIHENLNLFKCAQCKFRCVNASNLDAHLKSHAEKPFKCPTCQYSTCWKNSLNTHMKIHSGEKPFMCATCPYKCSTQGRLTVHMKIHTREKTYKCTQCKFCCKKSDDLKMHMKLHAGRLFRMEFYRKLVPIKMFN